MTSWRQVAGLLVLPAIVAGAGVLGFVVWISTPPTADEVFANQPTSSQREFPRTLLVELTVAADLAANSTGLNQWRSFARTAFAPLPEQDSDLQGPPPPFCEAMDPCINECSRSDRNKKSLRLRYNFVGCLVRQEMPAAAQAAREAIDIARASDQDRAAVFGLYFEYMRGIHFFQRSNHAEALTGFRRSIGSIVRIDANLKNEEAKPGAPPFVLGLGELDPLTSVDLYQALVSTYMTGAGRDQDGKVDRAGQEVQREKSQRSDDFYGKLLAHAEQTRSSEDPIYADHHAMVISNIQRVRYNAGELPATWLALESAALASIESESPKAAGQIGQKPREVYLDAWSRIKNRLDIRAGRLLLAWARVVADNDVPALFDEAMEDQAVDRSLLESLLNGDSRLQVWQPIVSFTRELENGDAPLDGVRNLPDFSAAKDAPAGAEGQWRAALMRDLATSAYAAANQAHLNEDPEEEKRAVRFAAWALDQAGGAPGMLAWEQLPAFSFWSRFWSWMTTWLHGVRYVLGAILGLIAAYFALWAAYVYWMYRVLCVQRFYRVRS